MLNFSTINHPGGLEQPIALVSRGGEPTRAFFIDPELGPIHTDLELGGLAGETLAGAPRDITPGSAVVINATVSGSGAALRVDASSDGTAWTPSGVFPLASDELQGVRFTADPGVVAYRARVVLGQAASRISVYSQVQEPQQ